MNFLPMMFLLAEVTLRGEMVSAVGALIAAQIALLTWAVTTYYKLRPELKEVQALRDRLREIEEREDAAATALRNERHTRKNVEQRVYFLEAMFPAAAMAANLQEMSDDLKAVLNEIEQPVVITATRAGGRFKFVNRAFARCLQMPQSELSDADWRTLIHPDDLRETSRAEAAAWDGPIQIVNRYRCSDGSYVTLRWNSTRYLGGIAFSVLHEERGEQH